MAFLSFSECCHGIICNLNVIVVLELICRDIYLLFAILFSTKFQKVIFYQCMRPKSGLKIPRPLALIKQKIVKTNNNWLTFVQDTGNTMQGLLESVTFFFTYCIMFRIKFPNAMSRLMGKPTKWFPNRSDTNWSAPSQNMARSSKFRI